MSKYALMLFYTGRELGITDKPGVWYNTHTYYYDNGTEALNAYANTPCPASQLIQASDQFELECLMGDMLLNFQDEEWLNENLYPYL
jgi:hypothetical protein